MLVPYIFITVFDFGNSFLYSNWKDGGTALHSACCAGQDSVVKLLINAHPNLGITDEVSITKVMALLTARIPLQHIEALCNACTDRYASYSNNSLPSSFSVTTCPYPPLSSPACYTHSDNSGGTTAASSMTLLMLYQCHYILVSKLPGCQILYGNKFGCGNGFC